MSNSDTTEVKLQEDGQDINSSRSVRIRKCPGCRKPHSEHFFGLPNKNCMDADGNQICLQRNLLIQSQKMMKLMANLFLNALL